jgi:hypothetical protein
MKVGKNRPNPRVSGKHVGGKHVAKRNSGLSGLGQTTTTTGADFFSSPATAFTNTGTVSAPSVGSDFITASEYAALPAPAPAATPTTTGLTSFFNSLTSLASQVVGIKSALSTSPAPQPISTTSQQKTTTTALAGMLKSPMVLSGGGLLLLLLLKKKRG